MESKKLENPRKNGAFSTHQAVMKPDEETGGVFPTMWDIDDAQDNAAIKDAKGKHNRMIAQLIAELQPLSRGIMVGASGCDLCKTCAKLEGQPCRFPAQQFSCMSAYCIYVEKFVEDHGVEYDSGPGIVNFFGIYLFDWIE